MNLWSRVVARLQRLLRRPLALSSPGDEPAAGSAIARRRFWTEFRAGRREAEIQSAKRRS